MTYSVAAAEPRRLEYMPLAKIAKAKRNPKRHDHAAIIASIEEHGYAEVGLLDERTSRLVAGHGRLEALASMERIGKPIPDGIKAGPDGKWLVPVLRGWSSRDDAEAERYLVRSNRLVELGGYDVDALAELMREQSIEFSSAMDLSHLLEVPKHVSFVANEHVEAAAWPDLRVSLPIERHAAVFAVLDDVANTLGLTGDAGQRRGQALEAILAERS